MQQSKQKVVSPKAYLAMERKAETKSEYYKGGIFAMAGASYNHNVIAGNIFTALNQFVAAKPCIAFMSDMRLLVEQADLYTYPDVMIVCGQPIYDTGVDDLDHPPPPFAAGMSR